MNASARLMSGKILLSVIAIATMVSPYIADWNPTHIYNPLWPPHAKFHNAQTMTIAVLLGASGLLFLWRRRTAGPDLLPTVLFIGLYWVSQLPAFLFPGVAWTDPNLLQPGQAMSDMPIQLKGDLVLLPLIALGAWLILQGCSQPPAA